MLIKTGYPDFLCFKRDELLMTLRNHFHAFLVFLHTLIYSTRRHCNVEMSETSLSVSLLFRILHVNKVGQSRKDSKIDTFKNVVCSSIPVLVVA